MRRVSTRVLPEPAGAMIASGAAVGGDRVVAGAGRDRRAARRARADRTQRAGRCTRRRYAGGVTRRGREKAPSSLRCVGSSDLLGAFPPAPSRRARPRRRPTDRLAGPCPPRGLAPKDSAPSSVHAPVRTYVRSDPASGFGVRRIGEPVRADITTAPRERQAEFRRSRLPDRVASVRAQFAEHSHDASAECRTRRGIDG